MFSWLCRKCDRTMHSAHAYRKHETLACIHCGTENINPYFVKGEDNEVVSVGAVAGSIEV